MTPAEDLRSAAVLLRQRAECAQRLMPGPWRVVFTDSESADGVASCPLHAGEPQDACDACSVILTYSEWVASYVAMLTPTVGMDLADLLNTIAEDMHRAGAVEDRAAGLDGQPLVVWVPGDLGPHEAWTAALRLARLITGGGS